MKLVRVLTVILLVLSLAIWGLSTFNQYRITDKSIPVISFPNEPLVISALSGNEALTADVTAADGKDGDLTARIYTDVTLNKGGIGTVTYSVADSDNHVTSVSRDLYYTDYHGPRFSLSKELRYQVGATVRVLERVNAYDLLDGDVSDRVKLSSGNVSTYTPGSYPITLFVANSCGDTASMTVDVIVESYSALCPHIYLTEYIVYPEDISAFHPADYISYTENCSISDITITVPSDGYQSGVNKVLFSASNDRGENCDVILYVVLD